MLLKSDYLKFKELLESKNIWCFFHITDRQNLESIKTHWWLLSWKVMKTKWIQPIRIWSSELSQNLDNIKSLWNYVRLSFNTNQPMIYVAKKEWRINNAVVLKIDTQVLYWRYSRFSNMNAIDRSVIIGENYEDFERLINLDFLIWWRWNWDSEKKKFQSEILVLQSVPSEYILNLELLCNGKSD